MLSTNKLADDEHQNKKTVETVCDIITKKKQLETVFEKLGSKVDTQVFD